MDKNTVTITVDEYKELIAAATRIDIFATFVNRQKYSIDREVCGEYLGFEVDDGTDRK